jgi:Cu2+-containing amine oxidase
VLLFLEYFDDVLNKVDISISHYEEIQKSSFPQKRPEYGDRALSEKPGPRTYMPEGPRYTVSGRTIKWMGWSFHAGYNFRAGPDFRNLMFKGDRIAYEVSLNEIGLLYAANDPVGANVNFLDSNFGNGEYREVRVLRIARFQGYPFLATSCDVSS